MKKIIVAVAFLAMANGCVTSRETARMYAPNMPAAFHTGYAHGCDSGLSAAGNPYYSYNKSTDRKDDINYQEGWAAGYDACKNQYSSLSRYR